jgi:1-deoxy-D-xylulose-5-phosphate reductoisomerase
MREIVILGSTGSIGVQALEIVEANPTLFRVVALTSTGKNPSVIIDQAKRFGVSVVGVTINADVIRDALPNVSVIDGSEASTEIAAITCDVVLNAITGSIGLGPTLSALKAGNRVALANKESLVAGGELVMKLAKPDQLIPVDSEHSAIWQSMMAGKKEENAACPNHLSDATLYAWRWCYTYLADRFTPKPDPTSEEAVDGFWEKEAESLDRNKAKPFWARDWEA